MFTRNILLILILCLCGTVSATDLTLTLTNIRSTQGKIYVFVYNYENQYPMTPYKHYVFDKSPDGTGAMQVALDGLPYGKYSIAVLDDENSNEKLDRWLGIPREGYGFSNKARTRFLDLPEFSDLMLEFNHDSQRCTIEMKYLL